MYTIATTETFKKSFEKLPARTQSQAASLIELLSIDYRDPRLHTKKLRGGRLEYSFRTGRDYRCIFCFESGSTILLLDIADRKDIYK